jgi:hypothetical protein
MMEYSFDILIYLFFSYIIYNMLHLDMGLR